MKHYALITKAHPDVIAIKNSAHFNAWLETQPYYKRVTETGTTAEVIQMLDEYKRSVKVEADIAAVKKITDNNKQ